ncbi:hypothetical protein BW1_022_00290 [Bacillus mycoides NBRC 101238 = DSM 11821]|nr:hypothetical protein BW1_022_00290 [Bacillus mycoides NBRC 101238 = DSM 11821]
MIYRESPLAIVDISAIYFFPFKKGKFNIIIIFYKFYTENDRYIHLILNRREVFRK